MVVYGMFFGAHQYSTALIKDGKILYAVENERIVGLNLQKHRMLL
jgi:predicted NodU family carbamoyl transferase